MSVLDYILNRCTLREIDALSAAVERRRRDLAAETGIISLDPARAARQMSETVQTSINQSMDSIRGTFRKFAADTIRKEAPELTDEQMQELVDSWIPKDMAMDGAGKVHSSSSGPVSGLDDARTRAAGGRNYTGLVRKGMVNGVPPDAMYAMICQFVTYSTGAMSLDEEAGLRDAVGDWTAVYWKKFPPEIRNVIKDFLAGSLTGAEFDSVLSALLK
jgi:hypothetical protein